MRNTVNKTALAVAVSLLVTACAGSKGDFGLNQIEPPKPESKPQYQDEQTEPRTPEQLDALMEPGLGFEAKIPRRNLRNFSDGNKAELSVNALNDGTLDIPHENELNQNGGLVHSHDGMRLSSKRDDFKYVRSGYVIDTYAESVRTGNVWYAGQEGYVYYKGINPSTALPAGKVSYKGTWDFTTDARYKRAAGSDLALKSSDRSWNNGDRTGTTSYNEDVNDIVPAGTVLSGQAAPAAVGHTSEFEIDFGSKTMTGRLNSNGYLNSSSTKQDVITRYTVEAQLSGNRFRGKAKAANPESALFGSDSNALEGGFYGPNAEELAGKFLTDNNTLLGVFAAKQNGTTAAAETLIDAVSVATESKEAFKNLNTFGDATKLFVNGTLISLLPQDKTKFTEKLEGKDIGNGKSIDITVCCSNTDYLKFGWYYLYNTADAQNKTQYLFLQGERTPVSAVAALTGTARYQGSWDGIIRDHQGYEYAEQANNHSGGSRAVFDVDFSGKTLSGQLYKDNGALPALNISGVIAGNGFTGKADTGISGFAIDAGNINDPKVTHIKDAEVKGGFYGPKAAEMGGYIHGGTAGGTVDAVFGARRQVRTAP